jgi:hypothetical protein
VDGRGRSLVWPAVLLLVVLLAPPAGVAWGRTVGGAAVTGHPAISGFRQHAEVDRDRYEEQEPVVLTYRVCRSRPWPATTNSPGRGSLAVDFRVVDEHGEVVADTTHQGHILVLVRTRWWPGQCRSMDVVWDQHRWNQDGPDQQEPEVGGVPARGDRVEPGDYRFEVWWLVSPGDEPDEQTPRPTETSPFVIAP